MYTAEELQVVFEAYRVKQLIDTEPRELYAPINYIMDNGGKRIRPVLLLLATDLFGGNIDRALPLAYAIELFHNFTLMHDDIMDGAPLRRGKPAVYKEFGMNSAILSGDVMQLLVYDYFQHLDDKIYRKVIQMFNANAIKVCEGQQWDMQFEGQERVSIDAYLKMIEYKTAALLAASLSLGALIAGADESQSELMYAFGVNMGICFQLKDDILDTYGDPAKFGKTVGGDILNDKKTYLQIKAIELAKDNMADTLLHYRKTGGIDDDIKVKGVTTVYNELGIRQLAEQEMNAYYNKAFEALGKLSPPKSKKQILAEFARSIYNRKY